MRALLCLALLSGCAPLAAQHRADAAFRQALTAQLRGDEAEAGRLYHEIVALGFNWSGVWNNLAVIAAHRREYIASRKLLRCALAADPTNLVALTNYGVMSFHLADLKEAERVLAGVEELRRRLLDGIPSWGGRGDFEAHAFRRRTEGLEATAKRYLDRIARAEAAGAAARATPAEAVAALALHRL